jgi:acyl dehydratase
LGFPSTISVGTTIANLGMTEVKFPAPLFEGDTLHVTTGILSKRVVEIAPRCRNCRIPPPRLSAGKTSSSRVPPPGFDEKADFLIP